MRSLGSRAGGWGMRRLAGGKNEVGERGDGGVIFLPAYRRGISNECAGVEESAAATGYTRKEAPFR